MPWNWQLPDWPNFHYDPDLIWERERKFLLKVGSACAFLKNISAKEYNRFVVEILSSEGVESSKIEGEFLDRDSLQSSIKRHFGLTVSKKNIPKRISNGRSSPFSPRKLQQKAHKTNAQLMA